MAERLYGDPRSKAFSMLKNRLFERMLETITLNNNLQNNPSIKDDTGSYLILQTQKMMLHATLLRRRGLSDLSVELYEKALKSSQEVSAEGLSLSILISLQNSVKSLEEYREELLPQITQSREKYMSDLLAIQKFDEYRLLRGSRASVPDEELDFLEDAIAILKNRLDEFPSPRALFYYYSLSFDHSILTRDFDLARKALKEVNQLFQLFPGLGARNRLGALYIKLANVEIITHQYQQGFEAACEAIKLLNPRRHNFRAAIIYKCFSCIYLNKYEEGLADISLIENGERSGEGIEYAIIIYLKSCIFYLKNDPRAAYHILLEASELMNDKEGWNVGIRIFEIILLIDLGKLDIISNKLDNLRKHLARYEVDDRMNVIYRVLTVLERNHFDFKLAYSEASEDVEELKQKLPWMSVSHEVIRFDDWFLANL
ncbi:MAG: hypothetical protein MRZ79_22340 [Bacteroidia bacterium]|nr:hypothetical protein [Bacteroidia bacterium]